MVRISFPSYNTKQPCPTSSTESDRRPNRYQQRLLVLSRNAYQQQVCGNPHSTICGNPQSTIHSNAKMSLEVFAKRGGIQLTAINFCEILLQAIFSKNKAPFIVRAFNSKIIFETLLRTAILLQNRQGQGEDWGRQE